MDSVRRLAGTTLELQLKKHDLYLNAIKEQGKTFQLMHLDWEIYNDQGLIVAVFPPIVAQWLDKSYTYIDWSTRKELTDLGKALHRFLSSQPKRYSIQAKQLAKTIGYDGLEKNLKTNLNRALNDLKAIGWLSEYHWRGTGRVRPLELVINRSSSPTKVLKDSSE